MCVCVCVCVCVLSCKRLLLNFVIWLTQQGCHTSKLEESCSLRLGVVWDRTLKISYNHKILVAHLLILVDIPMILLSTCEMFCSILLLQENWPTAIHIEDKYRTAMQSVAKQVGLNSKQVTFPQALDCKTVTPGQRTERISRHTSGIEAAYSSRVGLLKLDIIRSSGSSLCLLPSHFFVHSTCQGAVSLRL